MEERALQFRIGRPLREQTVRAVHRVAERRSLHATVTVERGLLTDTLTIKLRGETTDIEDFIASFEPAIGDLTAG